MTRGLAGLSFRLRLQPTEPGWLDMALQLPVMDTTRIRHELGWTPRREAPDVLMELLEGLAAGAEMATPPLRRSTSGPARSREFATEVGKKSM